MDCWDIIKLPTVKVEKLSFTNRDKMKKFDEKIYRIRVQIQNETRISIYWRGLRQNDIKYYLILRNILEIAAKILARMKLNKAIIWNYIVTDNMNQTEISLKSFTTKILVISFINSFKKYYN